MIGDSRFQSEEISLYVHIPFCTKKCPYCHFFVLPNHASFQEELLKGFCLEWEQKIPYLEGRTIVSIYFGGGTPSLFIEGVKTVLDLLFTSNLKICPNLEITIEANPETLTKERLKQLYELGCNRLSIGVQTFDAALLQQLGRTHSHKQAIEGIIQAHASGFKNISIDLMYDLPTQTLKKWKETVNIAMTLPIHHLSLYNLTIEPHTVFHKYQKTLKEQLPSEEESLAMLSYACQTLEKHHFFRYEISAFAKSQMSSRHNTGYWIGREFVGLGPSAFSYFQGKRFRNYPHLKKWVGLLQQKQEPIDFEEKLSYPDNLHELLAIHLRLAQGVHLPKFQKTFGTLPEKTHQTLKKLIQKQFLTYTKKTLTLTEHGKNFYDTVASEII